MVIGKPAGSRSFSKPMPTQPLSVELPEQKVTTYYWHLDAYIRAFYEALTGAKMNDL